MAALGRVSAAVRIVANAMVAVAVLLAPLHAQQPLATSVSLSIRVVDGSGRAISDATVVLADEANKTIAVGGTGPNGLHRFLDVPSGRYFVTATKGGFCQAGVGTTDPATPAMLVVLQQSRDLTIRMARGAAIAGKLVDVRGRPISNSQLILFQSAHADGFEKVVPLRAAANASGTRGLVTMQSAANGDFRFFGLAPGKYLISTLSQSAAPGLAGPVGRLYYPGTPDVRTASWLTVEAGQDLDGLVFQEPTVAWAELTGQVILPEGYEQSSVEFAFNPEVPLQVGLRFDTSGQRRRFTATRLSPGQYQIRVVATVQRTRARGRTTTSVSADQVVAAVPNGTTDVEFYLRPGVSLEGAVRIEGQSNLPMPDILLRPVDGARAVLTTSIADDSTFRFESIPAGRYVVELPVPAAREPPWTMSRAVINGQDRKHLPIDLRTNVTGAQIDIVRQPQEVKGVLNADNPEDLFRFTLVMFPADEASWAGGERRVISARPATDGSFVFTDVASGNYRLAVVLNWAAGQSGLEGTLRSLQPSSIPVEVQAGATANVSMRVGRLGLSP